MRVNAFGCSIVKLRQLVFLLLICSACQRQRPAPSPVWYGDNRLRLENLIREHGRTSGRYDNSRKPLAVFDWDNTVLKNDAGDATVFWMLQHDKVLQPPDRDWRRTSRYLTAAAAQALDSACGALAAPGAPLPTSTHPDCAGEIVTIYERGSARGGVNAMSAWNHRRMEPRYAWAAQLHAGYSPKEVRDFSKRAMAQNLANPIGAKQTVGPVGGLPAYVRVHEQIRDLIDKLKRAGFSVWVVTASSQYVVEPYADLVGIPAERVIGIRPVMLSGRFSYGIQGCGDVPSRIDGTAGAAGDAAIPYIDGKRCWINQIIFGDRSRGAWDRTDDSTKRPVFAAGDSETDVTFLRDATGLRLVINRNRTELQCYAYSNADRRWMVNPMFIEPMPRRSEPYACSTRGCTSESGDAVPCRDDDGHVIPDQEDRVF